MRVDCSTLPDTPGVGTRQETGARPRQIRPGWVGEGDLANSVAESALATARHPLQAYLAESRWRCFVAVPVGERLRDELAMGVTRWRRLAPDLRWSDPARWHVTLAFLGATDPDRLPSLADALDDVASRFTPFTLPTGGLGGFPSTKAARVVWYGIDDREGLLASLASVVRDAVGVTNDQPFRAHLTLARARGDARARIGGLSGAPVGEMRVEELVLYRSLLGQGPARYEPLAIAGMGAAVHV